eukprot:TRINITY_DN3289_c0_g1_i1.p5 TRINITY_DN3289_c0_g1~~TRINITY_DN3289_c0_g1_i1.p5  ORF type:complete len:113 (+),score=7.60 TRINITY_DN3289_c0_g1_i1:67-405(+)
MCIRDRWYQRRVHGEQSNSHLVAALGFIAELEAQELTIDFVCSIQQQEMPRTQPKRCFLSIQSKNYLLITQGLLYRVTFVSVLEEVPQIENILEVSRQKPKIIICDIYCHNG